MKKIKTEADLRAAQEQADALCYTDNQGIFYFLNYGAFFPAVREILISMPRICEQAHPHIHLAISGPRKGREFMRFIDNLAAYLQEATGDVNDPAPTFFVIPETDQFFVLHILRNRPDLFGYTARNCHKCDQAEVHARGAGSRNDGSAENHPGVRCNAVRVSGTLG